MKRKEWKKIYQEYYLLFALGCGLLLLLITGVIVIETKFNVRLNFILISVPFFAGSFWFGKTLKKHHHLIAFILYAPLAFVSLLVIFNGNSLLAIIPFAAVLNSYIGMYFGRHWASMKLFKRGIYLTVWLVVLATTSATALPRLITYTMIRKEFTQAPAFEFRTLDGSFLRSTDLSGKVVVLDFWATWCEPCNRQLPEIQQLYEEYNGDKLVEIITVNTGQAGDSLQQVQSFLETNRFTFPVVYDAGARVSRKLGVRKIPHTIIMDKKGRIRLRHTGYVEGGSYLADNLRKYIEMYLKER